ncbi:MAG: SDR family oxidoreductase [Granulosicoccus sp.]|nr:SDR family oxidoreductase [Granulosicoccus sp.]
MNKTILISGGSRGIGRATALLAAEQGWQVAFTYHSNADAAQATLSDIKKLTSQCKAIQSDVTSESDVMRAFAETKSSLGGLDAVVVNAGILGPSLPLREMPVDRMRGIFDTNILGACLFAREAARYLPETAHPGAASITFLSSAAARHGSPFEYVDYAASKGAIDTLTIGLSKELADSNIRVNGVRPGLIETEIHASGGQADRAQRLAKTVPMARPGSAEEVARSILWLCSDEASYCTGALLDVAGGR